MATVDVSELISRSTRVVRAKITAQGGVPTFYDNRILRIAEFLRTVDDRGAPDLLASKSVSATKELRTFLDLVEGPRYVDPLPRLGRSTDQAVGQMAVNMITYMSSQGVKSGVSWAGHPLFKTVFDGTIYPMLVCEVRPRSIIELGSGSGGSAVWLADIANSVSLNPKIISIDKKQVDLQDKRITFRQGDIFHIESIVSPCELDSLEHPWLVIEDAHVNVGGILAYFDPVFRKGDYLIVEDSLTKRDELVSFLSSTDNEYVLDTKYIDMFGENTTCAVDSIFLRQ